MKPTPEQVAAAKAYFATKPKPSEERRIRWWQHQLDARIICRPLRPASLDDTPRPDDFAPALASVLSAGLLGEVES